MRQANQAAVVPSAVAPNKLPEKPAQAYQDRPHTNYLQDSEVEPVSRPNVNERPQVVIKEDRISGLETH